MHSAHRYSSSRPSEPWLSGLFGRFLTLGLILGMGTIQAQPLLNPPGQAQGPPSRVNDPAAGLQAWQSKYSAETKTRLLKGLPKPMFVESAEALGITFQHSVNPEHPKMRAQLQIPMDIAGGGVSAADYNQDGFPDLFFCGYGGGRLFRNEGGKKFVDATQEAGLNVPAESRAAYFIDYDNDGDLDFFVTTMGLGIQLFENDGAAHFKNISEQAGLAAFRDITHEAVFFDMDNDGLLDIYTASFGRWDQGKEPLVGKQNRNGEPNRLFHQKLVNGKHVFEEIGASAGVNDPGWTHSVGAWDFDQDGKVDLFSFNDFARANSYHNLGHGKFAEWSIALNMQKGDNGMGFALMDLDGDGRFEAYVTEISLPLYSEGAQVRYKMPPGTDFLSNKTLGFLARSVNNRFYCDTGSGKLVNRHNSFFEPAEMGWSWGVSAIDYENDGDLDVLVLNGTEDNPPVLEDESRPYHLAQREFIKNYANDPNVFFMNEDKFMYNVSGFCELSYRGNSRSAAWLDFDQDGDLDVAINDYEGKAKFFRNVQPTKNSWVRFRLVGKRSNRHGFGARISVEDSNHRTQHAIAVSGMGFLSQAPLELHFGLGTATRVARVTIAWPSGITQKIENLDTGRLHTIVEAN